MKGAITIETISQEPQRPTRGGLLGEKSEPTAKGARNFCGVFTVK
jgi:hypothetical protein